jgi:ABC-2 type transport system ATP-binding protein
MSLIISNASVAYRDKTIIEHLTFTAESGKVLGIAGINGAGKSSTLKAIAGLIPFSAGEMKFNGKIIKHFLDKEDLKSVMGYCPDVGGIIPAATPREHINILLNLNRKNDKQHQAEALELLRQVNLIDNIDTPCGNFSHGMMRRMSVVLASLNANKMLILDEPFDGVDPTGIKSIQTIIETHKLRGDVVLVSSHLINVLSETCDEVMVMVGGKVLARETALKFKGDKGFKHYSKLLGI